MKYTHRILVLCFVGARARNAHIVKICSACLRFAASPKTKLLGSIGAKSLKTCLQIIICCGLSLAIAGCVSSTYVKRNQYLLNPQTFSIKQTKTHKYSVIVNSVSVAAPFNQLSFIYRANDHQYLTDYYHTFATPLSQQFDSLLLNYSYALGNFTPITIYNELSGSDYKLQPVITHFYADYRDRNHPQAVIALNLKLFKHEDKQIKVMRNKTFTARIPIQVKDTENLLAAWQQGLENVTTQGIRDLNLFFGK